MPESVEIPAPDNTAMADAAFLLGYAAWRVRRRLQRKPDTDPPHLLIDSIRHSVFCAGFRVPVAENPALREHTAPRPDRQNQEIPT